MPKVTKKAYFTQETYDATSEDLKEQTGSSYRIYYYTTKGWWTSLNLHLDLPITATDVKLNLYIQSIPGKKNTGVNINNADKGLAKIGWNTFSVDSRSLYKIYANGGTNEYPAYYYMYGINGGAYRPYVEYAVIEPSVTGLNVTGTVLDEPTVCRWTQTDATSCKLQVLKEGTVAFEADVTSLNTYTIPANTLRYTGEYVFKVIATRNFVTAETSISKTMTALEPVIENAILSSAEVERGASISTTVTGSRVDGYTVNILNTGNTVIASDVGKTFSTAQYPAGSYKAQIVAYHTNGYYTTYKTTTVPFKTLEYTPIIEKATLSSTHVEKGTSITSTASGTRVSGHHVNLLDDASHLIASNVGTTFSTSSLGAGHYKAQIVAYYTNGSYTTYANTTLDFTVFVYQGEITSVWPNGTRELRKSNIQLGFSAKNFTDYTLSAIQGGVTKYTTTGTNTSDIDAIVTKTFSMVNSLFEQGEVTVTVRVSNTRNGYTTTDHMTVKFTVIDNPNTPTLTYEQSYNTPRPVIDIACSSPYISYKIALDDVEGSEIFGHISSYYFESALKNNAYHTFKIKVKNTYGLWSDWGTATFYIAYAELDTPSFNVYTDPINGCISVAIESTEQSNFKDHSVLRLENGTWVEIGKELERICTFYDNSCASGVTYAYKVRANDTYGGYKESHAIEQTIHFTGTVLSIPWTNQRLKLEYYNSEEDVVKNVVPSNSDTYVEVCGLSLPKLKKGTLNSRSLQLNIAFKTQEKYQEFIALIQNDVLLLRDGKGLKMYCHIVPTNFKDYLRYYRCVTIAITEVYYKEGDFIEIPDRPFIWSKEEY